MLETNSLSVQVDMNLRGYHVPAGTFIMWVGQVTSSQVGQVTSSQVGQVTSSQVGQVTSSQMGQVTSSQVGQVTSSQVAQFNCSQVGKAVRQPDRSYHLQSGNLQLVKDLI